VKFCQVQDNLLKAYLAAVDAQVNAAMALSPFTGTNRPSEFGEALAASMAAGEASQAALTALQDHKNTHGC
jgi:hypothetical protein